MRATALPGKRPWEERMIIFMQFMKDESAATAFEYGLIAAAAGLALSAIMPIFANA